MGKVFRRKYFLFLRVRVESKLSSSSGIGFAFFGWVLFLDFFRGLGFV